MKRLHIVLKSIFFIAATLLILELNPQMVYASNVMVSEDPYTGQVLKVRVDGNNGTLIYFRSSADTFTIPATIRGFQNTTVTITGIEKEAFRNCLGLRTLTIPDTVTSIGENAFLSCSNLTTVNMPARLNSLGKYAFGECRSLRSITIPNGITVINDSMFSGCSSLTTVNLPDGITKIGRGAFKGCSSLASFTIPNSVTHIESLAFCRCSALKSIAIPSGITTIYEQTFKECTSLTNITLPEGITRIDDLAFDHCSSLAGIDLPDSLRGTGMFLFKDCRALKSITLPGNLTMIRAGMFENCSSLTSVSIPSSVTGMGGAVFRGCTSLKSIAIPDSVKCFEGGTFAGCTSLERVKFSSYDPAIGSYDFNNCTSLRSITIPEHIIYLGDHAFDGCSNLTEANFLGDAPYVNDFGVHVFDNCAPDFKIKYIFGKSGWSNPFHGYPAECIYDLNVDIPNASLPVNINPNSLEKLPKDTITSNIILKAQAGVGFVKLDWNSISGSKEVVGYNVYKATSPGTEQNAPAANRINGITYTDSDVQKGTTYYYVVKPVFADNSVGAASNEVAIAPRDASGTIQLTINNPVMSGNGVRKEIDTGFGTAPVIKNGRTFLPVRALITEMGGNVEWDGTTRKVTIIYNGKRVELWIGQTKASVNNIETTMEAAPFISSTGRTMLPLRFVGESLGCDVSWNGTTKSVTIAYDTAAVKSPSAANTPVPSALLPSGVPNSLPAPAIANLQLLKDDSDVSYFRLEVTVPDVVRTLDQHRPADGWVDLETSKKVDNGDWIADGGGLEVFMGAPVPGKSGVYYLTFELLDEGGLAETLINARKYTFKARFNYAYGVGDGYEYVYSPWSNELSGQSESYYSSNDNNDDGIVD